MQAREIDRLGIRCRSLNQRILVHHRRRTLIRIIKLRTPRNLIAGRHIFRVLCNQGTRRRRRVSRNIPDSLIKPEQIGIRIERPIYRHPSCALELPMSTAILALPSTCNHNSWSSCQSFRQRLSSLREAGIDLDVEHIAYSDVTLENFCDPHLKRSIVFVRIFGRIDGPLPLIDLPPTVEFCQISLR